MLAVVAKAITYGATFAAAGGVIFGALFFSEVAGRERDGLARFVAACALAGMLVSVLRIGIVSGTMTGEIAGMIDPTMTRVVLESSEGTATALRLAGLALIGLIALPAGKASRRSRSRWGAAIASIGALLAATSFAWTGHAGEVEGMAGSAKLPQALLCVHLAAIAFWLGALWPLHRLTYNNDLEKIAAVMRRFGDIAAVAVGLLLAAGMVLLWLILNFMEVYGSRPTGSSFSSNYFWSRCCWRWRR